MVKVSKTLAVVDFVAFKSAIKKNPVEGGRAYAYLRDFMNNKINEETLFAALDKLNSKTEFMVHGANADEVIRDLNQAIEMSVQAQFNRAAK